MSTFEAALLAENPLQIVGSVNAYAAIMAKKAGFQAIYLSGAACANGSFGLPDLGMTTLENVCEDTRRMANAVDLPLLVDMDTGWEDPTYAATQLIKAGAKAAHIEDQVTLKRCGHRDNKKLVTTSEMVARIQAAMAGKTTTDFYLIARTDAFASEGMDGVIERSNAYIEAGADAIFAEAFSDLKEYETLCKNIAAPVLANMTEFGKTPLFTVSEFKRAGVRMVLYPMSAFRAMNQAAFNVFQAIRRQGTQKSVIDQMQDRDTLYDFLDYLKFENEQP